MTTISAKFSEKELDYLTKIALENKLKKGDSEEPSLGKAMKELIKWCLVNQVDINKHHAELDIQNKKMLEQIHVTIPHLVYLVRLQLLLDSDAISDAKVEYCKQQTLDYLNKICGDFNSINYETIMVTTNEAGLKQNSLLKSFDEKR